MAKKKETDAKKKPEFCFEQAYLAKLFGYRSRGTFADQMAGLEPVWSEPYKTNPDKIRHFYTVKQVHEHLCQPYKEADESDSKAAIDKRHKLEQLRKLKIENDESEGELLPVERFVNPLTNIISIYSRHLESLPLQLKRQFPGLDIEVVNELKSLGVKARNSVATEFAEACKAADVEFEESNDRDQ